MAIEGLASPTGHSKALQVEPAATGRDGFQDGVNVLSSLQSNTEGIRVTDSI